ncbi:MAG: FtsX-like permease family protein, partial [Clostridia bacterium]
RQISNKVNTATISMTIISLMLLLTIIILSVSISMSQSTNQDIAENNLSDFTIKKSNYSYSDNSEKKILNNGLIDDFALKNINLEKYATKYSEYNKYIFNDEKLNGKNVFDKIQMNKLIEKYGSDMVNFDYEFTFIKESEYNKLMELYNKEELKVNLKKDEYVILSDVDVINDLVVATLKNKTQINVNGCKLTPKCETPISVAIENADMNSVMSEIVIKDELINENTLVESVICGNFIKNDEITIKKFQEYMKNNYLTSLNENIFCYFNTAFEMKNTSVGISAIMTFLGLYLGIIFAITSAAVLALIQLSESSDNKERFAVLEKIGADEKMLNMALFKQIAIFFLLPLVIALIHSVVGLSEVNKLISIFGNIDLTSNILIITLFIIAVYGGYFIVTYLCSKNIIHEKR